MGQEKTKRKRNQDKKNGRAPKRAIIKGRIRAETRFFGLGWPGGLLALSHPQRADGVCRGAPAILQMKSVPVQTSGNETCQIPHPPDQCAQHGLGQVQMRGQQLTRSNGAQRGNCLTLHGP